MLSWEILRNLPGWELCLTHVPEVPGQVDRLPLHQGCQQGHVDTYPKSLARWIASPSTRDVSRVTLAAFLLPAGRVSPILSSLLLNIFPPSLDFALNKISKLWISSLIKKLQRWENLKLKTNRLYSQRKYLDTNILKCKKLMKKSASHFLKNPRTKKED